MVVERVALLLINIFCFVGLGHDPLHLRRQRKSRSSRTVVREMLDSIRKLRTTENSAAKSVDKGR
jgi:hypothetical protein